jgi:hypothetical protein
MTRLCIVLVVLVVVTTVVSAPPGLGPCSSFLLSRPGSSRGDGITDDLARWGSWHPVDLAQPTTRQPGGSPRRNQRVRLQRVVNLLGLSGVMSMV